MPTRPSRHVENFKHLEAILRARYDEPIGREIKVFQEMGLPPILKPRDLSLFIGVEYKKIDSFCREESKIENHYRVFRIRKKNGSSRVIHAPRTYLKVVQWWILDNILSRVHVDDNVFGFVPSRNIVQNAQFHFGAKHILNVDIKDFFPSITISQTQSVFFEMGYDKEVSDMLAQICCLNGRVPQGAPTSPAIGNIVLRDLDRHLTKISSQKKIKYSRYADDLTFSSKYWIEDAFLSTISGAVKESGFCVNPKKIRFAGPGDRLEVTGVVINEKIQPSRRWRRTVRAKLHRIEHQNKLTRRQLSYLYGILGVARQYQDSTQMKYLSDDVRRIVLSKRSTVIGAEYYSDAPPFGLSELQAEALNQLTPDIKTSDLSKLLGVSKPKLKKILSDAYEAINVSNRSEAIVWVKQYFNTDIPF